MASLSDDAMLQWYTTEICRLHGRWAGLIESQRRTEYERIFDALCSRANLPKPALVWTTAAGGGFSASTWTMKVELDAVRLDPGADLRAWTDAATTLYHETRHTEQNFLIVLAILSGALPLPVVNSRAVQNGTSLPIRVSQELNVARTVVMQATIRRMTFSQDLLGRVRAWLDGKFGRNGRQFDHVMANSDAGGRHTGEYRDLPTEADAYRIEHKVRKLIRNQLAGDRAEAALATPIRFF